MRRSDRHGRHSSRPSRLRLVAATVAIVLPAVVAGSLFARPSGSFAAPEVPRTLVAPTVRLAGAAPHATEQPIAATMPPPATRSAAARPRPAVTAAGAHRPRQHHRHRASLLPLPQPRPVVSLQTSPEPTSTPRPTTSPAGFAGVFGSAPRSGAVSCSGQSGVVISGHTFEGIGGGVPAVTISGCHDVTVTGNDFIDDAEPIYVVDSTDVTITFNRYRNITGPHTRTGAHTGNFTQWDHTTGGLIADNKGIGGDTEDIISIYASGGTDATHRLLITRNTFEGTDWTSTSGSGILLGDDGGGHVTVTGNTLVNPGQVGIGVAGGTDIQVTDNTVYGAARPASNVGIYTWGQGVPCSNITVSHNTIEYFKPDGQGSGWWDGQNCGAIAGWSTNVWSDSLDPAALAPKL